MDDNEAEGRNMSKFVEFSEIWAALSFWQKLKIYLHAIIQYRLFGAIIIACSSLIMFGFGMLIFGNIYISLVVGGLSGVIATRY